MSRRGDGLLLKFLKEFVDAPLWCAPLGAAAVYFAMGVLPGWLPHGPSNTSLLVVNSVMRAAAPWVAGLVLAFGAFGAVKRAFGGRMSRPPCPAMAMATSSATVPPVVHASTAAAPACPRCGGAMVRRTARKGASAGQSFWGCNGYPKCQGTVH